MGLSPYNPHHRYRYKSHKRFQSGLKTILVILIFAGGGFWIGRQVSYQSLQSYKREAAQLIEEKDALVEELTQARTDAETARLRLKQVQDNYSNLMGDGPLQNLVSLLKEQIDAGLDPDRMAFVIRSARPPWNCSERETKRFVVSTPAYKGSDSMISVDEDETVIVKGSGISARNDKGDPEAWYDPGKPVRIVFLSDDGNGNNREEPKEGILPIHHSVITKGREYRFTVEDGARSFVKVTYDSCDYP